MGYRLHASTMIDVSAELTERRSFETAMRFDSMTFRAGVRHVF
jgi:hypothetical protein